MYTYTIQYTLQDGSEYEIEIPAASRLCAIITFEELYRQDIELQLGQNICDIEVIRVD